MSEQYITSLVPLNMDWKQAGIGSNLRCERSGTGGLTSENGCGQTYVDEGTDIAGVAESPSFTVSDRHK